jgi:hypothetical protein
MPGAPLPPWRARRGRLLCPAHIKDERYLASYPSLPAPRLAPWLHLASSPLQARRPSRAPPLNSLPTSTSGASGCRQELCNIEPRPASFFPSPVAHRSTTPSRRSAAPSLTAGAVRQEIQPLPSQFAAGKHTIAILSSPSLRFAPRPSP